jgi:hypothetical protein
MCATSCRRFGARTHELRRAKLILREASALFAQELDPLRRR